MTGYTLIIYTQNHKLTKKIVPCTISEVIAQLETNLFARYLQRRSEVIMWCETSYQYAIYYGFHKTRSSAGIEFWHDRADSWQDDVGSVRKAL